jgi:hypothetical protein
MSNFVPWRPSDRLPPTRFGLTQEQWRKVLLLQAHYHANPHLDWPDGKPVPDASPRLRFLRHLVTTGRINEGRVR